MLCYTHSGPQQHLGVIIMVCDGRHPLNSTARWRAVFTDQTSPDIPQKQLDNSTNDTQNALSDIIDPVYKRAMVVLNVCKEALQFKIATDDSQESIGIIYWREKRYNYAQDGAREERERERYMRNVYPISFSLHMYR